MTALEKRALWIVLALYALGWAWVWWTKPAQGMAWESKPIAVKPKEVSLHPAGAPVILDGVDSSHTADSVPHAAPDTVVSKAKTKDGAGKSSPKATKIAAGSTEKISINKASLAQLMRLPGVGEGTAQKILEYRAQHGPFGSLEALGEVKGLGDKKLAKLAPHVQF